MANQKGRKIRFHIYSDKDGEFRWRIRSRNGRILADSGEGYDLRSRAVEAARLIINSVKNDEFDVNYETLDN